jgi:hypothetical protein
MGGLLVPGSGRLVMVASKNPAKIAAATAAVQRCFPHAPITFQGVFRDLHFIASTEHRASSHCALV